MSKRKTHEEFVKEMAVTSPDIEILGEYINCREKVKVKCKKDNHIWEANSNNLLRGSGCPKCKEKTMSKSLSKTHSQFENELKLINPDIELIGRYINNSTSILCKCKKHNEIFSKTPGLLLRIQGCKKCASENYSKSKIKTHEQFIKELADKNPNIKVLGKYKNKKTKLNCQCKIDGYEWEVIPNSLLQGRGCPKCAGCVTDKTTEYFIKELQGINQDIKVLGKYIDSKTKIKVKCNICNHEWEATPNNLLKGSSCGKCAGNIKKTHQEFVDRIIIINPNIEIIGKYKGANVKIECRCKLDNYVWETKAAMLLRGSGCPKCSSSKGELAVGKYLKNNFIQYKAQHKFKDCKYKTKLMFDFYLPRLNIAIEYDGRQHFIPIEYFGGEDAFKQTQIRDSIKDNYCKSKSIKLIRIPYTIENIEEYLEEQLNINELQLSIL